MMQLLTQLVTKMAATVLMDLWSRPQPVVAPTGCSGLDPENVTSLRHQLGHKNFRTFSEPTSIAGVGMHLRSFLPLRPDTLEHPYGCSFFLWPRYRGCRIIFKLEIM